MTSIPNESPLWTEQLRIRSYDVDFTRRATLTSLYRFFLDAAWNHAEALGIGFSHLQSQNKFWVLSRLLLEVETYPLWGGLITLRTWPRRVKTVFAMRDFELLEGEGNRIAAGSSAWLVLDLASKRPQRLHKLAAAMPHLTDAAALDRDPEKLGDVEGWEDVFSAAVRYTDIDVNRHVNASQYISRILDAYPAGFLGQHAVRGLEVNYLGETREGDMLHVRTRQTAAGEFHHSLTKADNSEVCRARLRWDDRPAN